jgi:hypothetical protein
VGAVPEIIKPLKDVVVKATERVELRCEIAPGDPKCDLHWYKDNKEIYSSKRSAFCLLKTNLFLLEMFKIY